jgi:integrase
MQMVSMLHDSRSRSPSGTPDNVGNVIRPSLRESLCEERLHFQNYNILSLDRGRRQRGTTRQTSESRARRVESKLIEEAERKGPSAVLRRAPLLHDFAPRFLEWVDCARHLAPKSRGYYRVGWNQIRSTPLMGMNLDRITSEELDSLALAGSPSYVNQALRTLRRLLGKVVEWKVIAAAPTVKLMKELGRELTIDPETEAKLLAVAKQPLKDVLVVIQDTGMRPEEVFRVRIENIHWSQRLIFNPNGKTKAARRHVPISERMLELLLIRCSNRPEGLAVPFSQG